MAESSWAGTAWDQHPVFCSTKRILDLLYPDAREDVRLVDLGCLEGGFSLELARLGFSVLGIEVRDSNFAVCQEVERTAALPNLRFVQDDAKRLPAHGTFDVVFCSGLLYHLDEPRSFLEMLGRQTKRLLVLNTHVATYQPHDGFDLGEIEEHEGLLGRWYREYGTEEEFANRDEYRLSAWDNWRSFWIERTQLVRAVRDAGFDTVFEQFDQHGDGLAAQLDQHAPGVYDRCQIVALKAEASHGA